jgi:glycosyltransferase involved in cell wall biosynthesis
VKVLEVNDVAGTAAGFTEGLRRLGHQAELFQPTVGTYRRSLAFRAMIPAIRALESRRMGRLYRGGGFDRLHIHYETFGVMGIVAGIPYDLHCHGGMVTHGRRPLSSRVIALCLARARRVFYATPNLAEQVLRFRPDATFVPNPVDVERFTPADGRERGRFRIFSISKMDTTKGWDHILAVLEALRALGDPPEIEAFGFGTEPRSVVLRRIRALEACGVRVLPRLDRDGVRSRIRDADLVLGQFAVGAAGMSELEALACAKPVCCRFDFGHAYPSPPPFLTARTVEETVAAVERARADRAALARVGGAGRAWVVRHHSIEAASRVLAERMEH